MSSIFCLPTRPHLGSLGRVIDIGGPGVQHAARRNISVNLADCSAVRSLGLTWPGVVELFGLFFRVQVVEVAKPFVKPMHGGQELVAVALMVLAELRGGVALRLEHLGERGVGSFESRAGEPGMPMVVMPVRMGNWPMRNAARPAVQLGWP